MALDLSQTATKLLDRLGSSTYVTIKKISGQTFDPVLGELTGGTETQTLLTAAVTDVAENLIDGERIQVGDKQVIFDNKVSPDMKDIVNWDNVDYKIVMIGGFNHAGVQQFWKVICRK